MTLPAWLLPEVLKFLVPTLLKWLIHHGDEQNEKIKAGDLALNDVDLAAHNQRHENRVKALEILQS